jgi:glucose/arabinose dehydrogenase
MKLLAKVVAGLIALLVLAVAVIWMMVPMNVPWKSMLQQMTALPAWLDPDPMSAEQVDSQLVVPEGYGVSLFATGIADARMLRVTSAGDVLVATPRDGRVILLEADRNNDGAADGQRVLLEGLTRPNGLDLSGGYLYVGEEDGIGRIEFDPRSGTVEGGYQRVINGLPGGGNHWKKTIRFGPDGLLYVALGSSCNVCIEDDARRAAMLRYTPEGEFVDAFATGLRNSSGFDWSPATGVLYATENGRDMLGDDFPPGELNAIVEGGFYGWPFANGANVPDPDLGADPPAAIEAFLAPAHGFRAHNAPLGIVFLRHDHHPPDYREAAIVALHGSWNRSRKDGYKVVSLHFATDGSIEERDFVTGFLADDVAIGRPAEVAEGPDGSIYVSDDYGSAVYRIRYGDQSGVSILAPEDDRSAGYDPTAISAQERESALAVGSAVLAGEGCLVCHVESPSADPAQVVLSDIGARFTVDELMEYLAMPNAPMPPYDADADQRRALAIFLLESY